ncbi:MAG: hypothetical protein JWN48_6100 [Myxococcaceae bacterium]|nr:hypothetical protein [Myxococcaceae bacterium]
MNSKSLRRRVRAGIVATIVSLCALACVGPSTVCAQSEHGAGERADSETQTPEYRELIEQALSEFKHKNWPESRVLFRRAHEISPNARTQRGIGMVSYEMRDYVNAVLSLSAALADSRQPLTDTQRKECEALLSRSRTFVGAYTLKLEPPQADVSLDGAALARDAEGHVLVPFGEHTLRAVAPGYQDSNSKLSVQGGETGELRIVLYRPQAVSAAPASSVEKSVTEVPSATQTAALSEPGLPRSHSDRFVGHGIRYSWITLGATAAFGAAAAAVWFTGQGKVDDLDSACARQARAGAPCQRGQVDTAGVKRHEHATTALLGLTGAALITTAVLMSLEWPTEKRAGRAAAKTPRKLALELAPQRLFVRGSF